MNERANDGSLPLEQSAIRDRVPVGGIVVTVAFRNRLSEREQLSPFYATDGKQVRITGGNGYRLPTEAEWEYVCRAGTTTRWWFGDDKSRLGEFAWYHANSGDTTHPVGQKTPNVWGVHDMHGNVREWCADWYAAYSAEAATNPLGPAKGLFRVLRGGSWERTPRGCRLTGRDGCLPDAHSSLEDSGLGFRVDPQAAIVPLLAPPGMDLRKAAKGFHQRGIFLNAIEYPAVPRHPQRFRASVMATHTRTDLDRLATAAAEVFAEACGAPA